MGEDLTIHDVAGPCEPGYHRGAPTWQTCRCGKVPNRKTPDWDQLTLAPGEVLVLTFKATPPADVLSDIQSSVPEWLHDRVVFVDGTTFDTGKAPV